MIMAMRSYYKELTYLKMNFTELLGIFDIAKEEFPRTSVLISGGIPLILFFIRLRQFDFAVFFLEGFDLAADQVEDFAVDGTALVGRQVFQFSVSRKMRT